MLTVFVVIKYRSLKRDANDAAGRADHSHAALVQLVLQCLAGQTGRRGLGFARADLGPRGGQVRGRGHEKAPRVGCRPA